MPVIGYMSNYVQFFNLMAAILIFFYSNGIIISYLDSSAWLNLILAELVLFQRVLILPELVLYKPKNGVLYIMSDILDF